MSKTGERQPKSLTERGFDLDRKINVVTAIGATAVGMLAPPLAVPAALVAGGSIAAIPISDRLRQSVVRDINKVS